MGQESSISHANSLLKLCDTSGCEFFKENTTLLKMRWELVVVVIAVVETAFITFEIFKTFWSHDCDEQLEPLIRMQQPEKRTHHARSVLEKKTLTFAYCVFRQEDRKDYGRREAEWLAHELTRPLSRHFHVVMQECYPDQTFLEKVNEFQNFTLEEKLEKLGLKADMRLCYFGTTNIVNYLIESFPGTAIQRKKLPPQIRNKVSGDGFIQWPKEYTYVGFPNGTRVGPLHIRKSNEPWLQMVAGVEIQLETKRFTKMVSPVSIPIYQPYVVSSNPMRMKKQAGHTATRWTKSHGCCLEDEKSLLYAASRRGYFSADAELRRKRDFASFIQSHCYQFRKSTGIRHAFVYTLAKMSKKPISLIGRCPMGEEATTAAGSSAKERKKTRSKYSFMPTVEVHSYHKFAIVFENSFENGYITEKIMDAYLARTVPIYFGSDRETLEAHLNMKAFVHCDIPATLISERQISKKIKQTCNSLKNTSCAYQSDLQLMKFLEPHLSTCAEKVVYLDSNETAYKEMISQDLLPNGRLSGIWNMTHLAELLLLCYRAIVHNEDEFMYDQTAFGTLSHYDIEQQE